MCGPDLDLESNLKYIYIIYDTTRNLNIDLLFNDIKELLLTA